MELMSIRDAIEFVEKFKKIYPNDYEDISLSHGGKYFLKEDGHYYKMADLEEDLQRYRNKNDIQYKALVIKDELILNKYELLDISNINLHCPDEIVCF